MEDHCDEIISYRKRGNARWFLTKETSSSKYQETATLLYTHFSPLWRCGPTRAMTSSFLRFLDHTQRCITVGRTSVDEWSALADASTRQHITLITNIHAPSRIRGHSLSRRAAADLRLRPRGHWDRHCTHIPNNVWEGDEITGYFWVA